MSKHTALRAKISVAALQVLVLVRVCLCISVFRFSDGVRRFFG